MFIDHANAYDNVSPTVQCSGVKRIVFLTLLAVAKVVVWTAGWSESYDMNIVLVRMKMKRDSVCDR